MFIHTLQVKVQLEQLLSSNMNVAEFLCENALGAFKNFTGPYSQCPLKHKSEKTQKIRTTREVLNLRQPITE